MSEAKVIAITNQKGGVAKSTTTVNLGVGLSKLGKKVLVIDADPQGSLSVSLGIRNPDEIRGFSFHFDAERHRGRAVG